MMSHKTKCTTTKLIGLLVVLFFHESKAQIGIGINGSALRNSTYNVNYNPDYSQNILVNNGYSFSENVSIQYKWKDFFIVESGIGYSEQKLEFYPPSKREPRKFKRTIANSLYDNVEPLKIKMRSIFVPINVKFFIYKNKKWNALCFFGAIYTNGSHVTKIQNETSYFTSSSVNYFHKYEPIFVYIEKPMFQYSSGIELQHQLSSNLMLSYQVSYRTLNKNYLKIGIHEHLYQNDVQIRGSKGNVIYQSGNLALSVGLSYWFNTKGAKF